MNNDEMNKKMEFIVEQQAKFTADIQIMREVQATESKLRNQQNQRLSDGLISMVDIVGSLARAQMQTEDTVNSLADSVHNLTQAQMHTDERLNSLINVVERFISGNGGAENRA